MFENRTQPLPSGPPPAYDPRLQQSGEQEEEGHDNLAFTQVFNLIMPTNNGRIGMIDPSSYVPGVSMPNPVENLSKGVSIPIPSDRLASIESLKLDVVTGNPTALDYLMSNEGDFCVKVTKYDEPYEIWDTKKFIHSTFSTCGFRASATKHHDTSKNPEKLIAGPQKMPLFDITSWETSEHLKPNPYKTMRRGQLHPKASYDCQKFNNFFTFREYGKNELFGYQSKFESHHWFKASTFECADMMGSMVTEKMIASYRQMWDDAHKMSNADVIYKVDKNDMNSKKIIGKTLISPFEFMEENDTRKDVNSVTNQSRFGNTTTTTTTTTTTFFLDHAATFNMECRIFNSEENSTDDPTQIQYRIRAITDYPSAEKSYKEPGKKENGQKALRTPVTFAILDGKLTEEITSDSILGSAVMESYSNQMAIKFPNEAKENDRVRLFASLVMLENFMRSRSFRDEKRQDYLKPKPLIGCFRFLWGVLFMLIPVAIILVILSQTLWV